MTTLAGSYNSGAVLLPRSKILGPVIFDGHPSLVFLPDLHTDRRPLGGLTQLNSDLAHRQADRPYGIARRVDRHRPERFGDSLSNRLRAAMRVQSAPQDTFLVGVGGSGWVSCLRRFEKLWPKREGNEKLPGAAKDSPTPTNTHPAVETRRLRRRGGKRKSFREATKDPPTPTQTNASVNVYSWRWDWAPWGWILVLL